MAIVETHGIVSKALRLERIFENDLSGNVTL